MKKPTINSLYKLEWELKTTNMTHYYEAKEPSGGSFLLTHDRRLFYRTARQRMTDVTKRVRYGELGELLTHIEEESAKLVLQEFKEAFAKLESME